MNKALLLIDLQMDYFEGGLFPLWNTQGTLENILAAIDTANQQGVPVLHIQHIADPAVGLAPFFNAGTEGATIHSAVLAAAPDAPVIVKHYADSFEQTNLERTLSALGVEELLICGMMTQNCVTHTAISRGAEKYRVTMLTDCSTTVNEMLHRIALHAVSTRVRLAIGAEAFRS